MLINIYLIYLGVVLFSLVLKKHYKEILTKEINIYLKFSFICLAMISLLYSLIMFIEIKGLSLGITYFIAYLSLNIIFIAMLYTYLSKKIMKLTVVLFILTLLLTIL